MADAQVRAAARRAAALPRSAIREIMSLAAQRPDVIHLEVADRYARRWSMPVSPDQVVITTGAIGGLFSALLTVLDPGDEVLIPDPGWPNYESIPHLAGAKAVRYAQPAENGFLPSLEEILRLT